MITAAFCWMHTLCSELYLRGCGLSGISADHETFAGYQLREDSGVFANDWHRGKEKDICETTINKACFIIFAKKSDMRLLSNLHICQGQDKGDKAGVQSDRCCDLLCTIAGSQNIPHTRSDL